MPVREDVPAPLWEHLEELRTRILWALGGWLLATIAAWAWSDRILRFLVRPPVDRLIFTAPTEPFFAHVRVALVAGLVASFPWILYQVWLFVSPGLKEGERRVVFRVLPPAYFLFLGGAALGFLAVGPAGLKFLLSYSSDLLRPYLSLGAYLRYMTALAIGAGILFQLPLVLWVLGKLGLVSAPALAKYRRHVFLGLLLAAAIVTPGPDVFSQLLLALPAYLLYEASVWVVRLTGRA